MYLLDKNDKELIKFDVDLGRLSFLGKELGNVSIYTYPIIIFEFMTGYYTTEEIYKKNKVFCLEFAKNFEVLDIPKDFSKSLKPTLTLAQSKSSNNDIRENRLLNASTLLPPIKESQSENLDIKKKVKNLSPDTKTYDPHSKVYSDKLNILYENKNQIQDNKNSLKSTNTIVGTTPPVIENPVSKKEVKASLYKSAVFKKKVGGVDKKNSNDIKPIKSFIIPYFEYVINFQKLKYFINPQEQENNKDTNSNFVKELEIFKEGLEKYKRKLRILKMEKEIEFLTRKNKAIEDLNKDLEDTIKHKKEKLQNISNELEPNKKQYEYKLNLVKNNLKSRGQHQLIYDSFVYQKMVEVCFIFFNSKIKSLYNIPTFYNESLTNDTKKLERLEYYNNDKKNISSMMGHICQLLVYLSKIFNIPMRYPIYLNGSRCYILRSLKDKMFLPLYLDTKKEDRHGIFEIALNCLKDDIKEIFNFFAMFPEIISKSDNETINNMNGNYLFFFFFVVFNHSLFRFMKTIQNNV